MLDVSHSIVKKAFSNSDQTDSCDILVFNSKIAFGHIILKDFDETLEYDKSICLEYNGDFQKFLDYSMETFVLVQNKSEESSEISLCSKTVKISRNTTKSPLFSVSKISILGDRNVIQLYTKQDLLDFLCCVHTLFPFGISTGYDDHHLFNDFLKYY